MTIDSHRTFILDLDKNIIASSATRTRSCRCIQVHGSMTKHIDDNGQHVHNVLDRRRFGSCLHGLAQRALNAVVKAFEMAITKTAT
jgi:hypothetical protein